MTKDIIISAGMCLALSILVGIMICILRYIQHRRIEDLEKRTITFKRAAKDMPECTAVWIDNKGKAHPIKMTAAPAPINIHTPKPVPLPGSDDIIKMGNDYIENEMLKAAQNIADTGPDYKKESQ